MAVYLEYIMVMTETDSEISNSTGNIQYQATKSPVLMRIYGYNGLSEEKSHS